MELFPSSWTSHPDVSATDKESKRSLFAWERGQLARACATEGETPAPAGMRVPPSVNSYEGICNGQ